MTITHCAIEMQPFKQADCCSSKTENFHYQKTLDSICRIAIGVFAAIYAPLPFLFSFQVGLLSGISYAAYRLHQNQPMFPDGENKPVCAQGYMDFLSGMKFPPPAGTLATAAFIVAHTRCDPSFYAPFCGFFIGFCFGRQGTEYGRDLYGHVVNYLTPQKVEIKQHTCPCKLKVAASSP